MRTLWLSAFATKHPPIWNADAVRLVALQYAGVTGETSKEEFMFRYLKAPLYLGVATTLLLGGVASAQAPSGGTGAAPAQTAPSGSPPPPTTSPPASTAPAPSAPSAAPSGSTQPSGSTRGSTTLQQRDSTSPGATVGRTGRSERFDSGRRISREDRFDDRQRFRRGDRFDRRDRFRPAFAFISGPRVVVRPGWCRGLHRGWHSAPGVGEHAGTHRGLFRC